MMTNHFSGGITQMMTSYPKKRGPWTTLSSEIKYQNPWITVREDQVLRPDGNPGIYGVVVPKEAVGVVAVSTDPKTDKLQIYLVGQYRYPTGVYSWELIDGGSEDNENPLDTAKRELREEAGIIASSWSVLAQDIQLSNCFTSELAHIFLARDLTFTHCSPDPTEELVVKVVEFSEAVEMVHKGEITDAISVMGVLLAERALR